MQLGWTLGSSAPSGRRRAILATAVVVVALAVALLVHLGGPASGSDVTRCRRFRADSLTRASVVTGATGRITGTRVVVIGDSWSAGLGLDHVDRSWPSRLPGRVAVAGFSGSGFTADASPCGRVSFADRAPAAVRRGADLVVVEGGLNDVDQSDSAIIAGFARLMAVLDRARVGRVVVVGPAAAPSREVGVPRVDALLAGLAASYGVDYVSTDDLRLGYLSDQLHLTEAGHRAFGDAVAARLAAIR